MVAMKASNICVSEPELQLRELDLSTVVLPPRSQLISLPPFGVGSGAVESLWGYLQRLASAHAVRFLDLLVSVGAPIVRHSKRGQTLGVWKHEVSAANGSTVGHRLAIFFGKLTCRADLESLTLRCINDVPGLCVHARETHAWCPLCLAEDPEPYDRLLWAVADSTHCPKHQCSLVTRCVGCGRTPRLFSTRSSVLHCDHCGCNKGTVPSAKIESSVPADFGVWQSRQIEDLLKAVSGKGLVTRELGPRAHNLRVSASLPEIRGVTGLARELGLGRSTPWGWLNEDRIMPLKSATRWAWITGTSLRQLFFEGLPQDALRFRPLPEAVFSRHKRSRRPVVPTGSTALFLAALRLSAENPFLAPKKCALEKASGVHSKHVAFKDVHFIRLIGSFRERERRFLRKERIWREITDVHGAAINVVSKRLPLGRHRVAAEMSKPGSFGGALARAYLRWLKSRLAAGHPIRPKIVPLDVRAYWDLQKQRSLV